MVPWGGFNGNLSRVLSFEIGHVTTKICELLVGRYSFSIGAAKLGAENGLHESSMQRRRSQGKKANIHFANVN